MVRLGRQEGHLARKTTANSLMIIEQHRNPNMDRAFLRSKAQGPRLSLVENMQRLPSKGHRRLKKKVQYRFDKTKHVNLVLLNRGTMSDEILEIVKIIKDKKIDILLVQETKWKEERAAEIGDLGKELSIRTQSGKNSWRKYSGVVCDRWMPIKLKSKIQRQVVRPTIPYSSETWATKRRDENRIDVTEMRMLRWQCGLTEKDKLNNKRVRGTFKVAPALTMVREHIKRRQADHPMRKMMDMLLQSGRRVGRTKLRWIDCVKRDMRELVLREEDVLDRRK
ncbi:uncharacterized protein [Palaemon carinicauda]|uniref:uncharacterized protein n=1 Tax=Palaemon carinicauda TaxID=392227 RepID=UPI0035B5C79E